MKLFTLLVILSIGALSCKKDNTASGNILYEYNFEQDLQGWNTGFADYTVGAEAEFELQTNHTYLPAPLNTNKKALFISGKNLSDDLFMYLKKELSGLQPNTNYKALFTIKVASNAPSNAIGVGGAPGESVYLGIGITQKEPDKIIDGPIYRMNIEKGNQSTGGKDRKVIGNIANGTSESNYVMLTKKGEFLFTTNDTGTVWAMVSTDSGFESTTALYYDDIKIELQKL